MRNQLNHLTYVLCHLQQLLSTEFSYKYISISSSSVGFFLFCDDSPITSSILLKAWFEEKKIVGLFSDLDQSSKYDPRLLKPTFSKPDCPRLCVVHGEAGIKFKDNEW